MNDPAAVHQPLLPPPPTTPAGAARVPLLQERPKTWKELVVYLHHFNFFCIILGLVGFTLIGIGIACFEFEWEETGQITVSMWYPTLAAVCYLCAIPLEDRITLHALGWFSKMVFQVIKFLVSCLMVGAMAYFGGLVKENSQYTINAHILLGSGTLFLSLALSHTDHGGASILFGFIISQVSSQGFTPINLCIIASGPFFDHFAKPAFSYINRVCYAEERTRSNLLKKAEYGSLAQHNASLLLQPAPETDSDKDSVIADLKLKLECTVAEINARGVQIQDLTQRLDRIRNAYNTA